MLLSYGQSGVPVCKRLQSFSRTIAATAKTLDFFSEIPLIIVTTASIAAAFLLITAHIPITHSLNFMVLSEISIVLYYSVSELHFW